MNVDAVQIGQIWNPQGMLSGMAGRNTCTWAESAIHRQDFFFAKEASALLLKPFNILKQVYPDLFSVIQSQLIIDFNHISKIHSQPHLSYYLIE